jgi:hypothetical protein
LYDNPDGETVFIDVNESASRQVLGAGIHKFPGHAFFAGQAETLINDLMGQSEDFLYSLLHIFRFEFSPKPSLTGQYRIYAVTGNDNIRWYRVSASLYARHQVSLPKKIIGLETWRDDGSGLLGLISKPVVKT